jgi:hypothetical protein
MSARTLPARVRIVQLRDGVTVTATITGSALGDRFGVSAALDYHGKPITLTPDQRAEAEKLARAPDVERTRTEW